MCWYQDKSNFTLLICYYIFFIDIANILIRKLDFHCNCSYKYKTLDGSQRDYLLFRPGNTITTKHILYFLLFYLKKLIGMCYKIIIYCQCSQKQPMFHSKSYVICIFNSIFKDIPNEYRRFKRVTRTPSTRHY